MSFYNKSLTQIFAWSIIGGTLGALVGFLKKFGVVIPVYPILPTSQTAIILIGTALGMFIGGIISGINYLHNNGQDKYHKGECYKKLQLKKEQLNISKKMIQTGQVNIHKEVINEKKTITVPITREELVIEKNDLYAKGKETIRIPISEERIEVKKSPEVINDVSINKNRFQEYKSIQETLKKENVHLEINGNPKLKKLKK